jgi:hypothetical protein
LERHFDQITRSDLTLTVEKLHKKLNVMFM